MAKPEKILNSQARNLVGHGMAFCHSGFELLSTFGIRNLSLANAFSGLGRFCKP